MQGGKKLGRLDKISNSESSAIKNIEYNSEKRLIQKQLMMEKERHLKYSEGLKYLKAQEKKLDEDCLRYSAKIYRGKQRIEIMKKNIGNTEFFIQQNPHFGRLLEQIVIEKATQEGNQNDLNPDNMTYEQLLQLGQQIGKVSKGLSEKQIQSLHRVVYKKVRDIIQQKCSICYQDYKSSDNLIHLHCEHYYHEQCLIGWMKNEKVCPLCKQEIL